jgi:hypothetical protein
MPCPLRGEIALLALVDSGDGEHSAIAAGETLPLRPAGD